MILSLFARPTKVPQSLRKYGSLTRVWSADSESRKIAEFAGANAICSLWAAESARVRCRRFSPPAEFTSFAIKRRAGPKRDDYHGKLVV